jgi:hypothetical protein
MDFVDVKYINLISARFQKFKKIKNNLYNFRCPICGDSQKNKSKARGYLYQVKIIQTSSVITVESISLLIIF